MLGRQAAEAGLPVEQKPTALSLAAWLAVKCTSVWTRYAASPSRVDPIDVLHPRVANAGGPSTVACARTMAATMLARLPDSGSPHNKTEPLSLIPGAGGRAADGYVPQVPAALRVPGGAGTQGAGRRHPLQVRHFPYCVVRTSSFSLAVYISDPSAGA